MLRVLGPISIDGPDGHHSLSRLQRQLLAALVAAGPNGITLGALADEIWGNSLPTTWPASLRNHLTRLRPLVAPAELPTRGGVCRLDLPASEVDAWLLLAPRTPEEWTDDLVWLLEPSVPYEDIDPTDRIAQSTNRIVAARRRILDALVREHRRPLTIAIRDVMRSSAIANPFDEHLTTLSATADAMAGEIVRALETVEQSTAIIRHELGDAACRSLDDLTNSLVSQPRAALVTPPSTVEPAFPAHLDALTSASPVARTRQLAEATEWLATSGPLRFLSIEGEWAAGKSRFLARIARSLFDGGAAVRFASGSPSSLAYEGILAALPELRPTLAELAERHADLRSGTDDAPPSWRVEQTVVWSRAAEVVEQLATDRPLVLAIDDADLIDTPSSELLAFLLRSQLAGDLAVITASLRGKAPVPITGSGVANRTTILLEPLDRPAIGEVVGEAFPEAPQTLTEPLADVAMQLSGGFPSLVQAVLDATDPITLQAPADLHSPDDVIASLLTGLEPFDVTVGTAVAVLGRWVADHACLSDISAVAEGTLNQCLASLDRLSERRLLHEGPRPDAFRVRHSPAAMAFLTACSRSQLRSMHATAARLVTTPHRRAHHMVAAMPLFDAAEVVTELEISARDHLARGAVREALDELRKAYDLAGNELSATSLGLLAVCLSRLGESAEANRHREAAFALAAVSDDWEAALDVATAGQNDDLVRVACPDRLALLERIPRDRLTPRSRGLALASMAVLSIDLGKRAMARNLLTEARDWCDQRDCHELARAEFLTSESAHPTDRLRRVRAALGVSDSTAAPESLTGAQQLVASQLQLIDLYMLGETDLAIEQLERFEHLGTALDSVPAQWHALLIRSMLALSANDRDEAERLSVEAHGVALRYAIVGGDEARLAQLFFAHSLDGTHGALLPLLLQIPDQQLIPAAESAIAMALLADDRVEEAIEKARSLMTRITNGQEAASPTIAAALTDTAVAAAELGDPSIATDIARLLEPLSGTIVILGTGVIDRGPVDASLAILEPKGSDKRSDLLDAAADLAQRSGSALWQKQIVSLR